MMYEQLVKSLRICGDSVDAIDECCYEECIQHQRPIDPLCMQALCNKAADAIEERDRYALTIQHEMMAEAESHIALVERLNKQIEELSKRPEIPETGIGDLSDGYHTFNGLYYQRMVLFAALVNAHQNRAWKSWKHEDGKPCFDGGWFIVGIDTPKGSYTYHYEDKYWNWFECEELPVAKHWDGHTEADVIRLLSLPEPPKEESDG